MKVRQRIHFAEDVRLIIDNGMSIVTTGQYSVIVTHGPGIIPRMELRRFSSGHGGRKTDVTRKFNGGHGLVKLRCKRSLAYPQISEST